MNKVDQLIEDIRSLRIQGARNVARAALDALGTVVETSKTKDKNVLLSDILEISDTLAGLRATEPMLINLMRYFTAELSKGKNVADVKSIWQKTYGGWQKKSDEGFESITEYGSNLIKDGRTILTHCHSSTVESALLRAAETKRFKVICTETRPMYQGRITAKKLSQSSGIDVTMITDSAVGHFIKDVDMVMVGADIITVQGQLVNKIGTSTIATVAYNHGISFYSVSELWKYDPMTRIGEMRGIEIRDPHELTSDMKESDLKELKKVKIINPGFDLTEARYISAYVTEEGILPPQNVVNVAAKFLKL
jgi:ribose 1,5-bisphosphate isomerase